MGLGHDGADTAATRSGLAFAFLDLVARYRPEAVLLENVPGLLSSHRGKDFGALLRRLGDERYGWAYRVLDAQWAGVPQRRRRVFILALDLDRHPDPDSAGKVLAVGAGCGRDHPAERAARAGAAGGAAGGAGGSGVVGSLSIGGHVGIQPNGQDAYTGQLVVGAPTYADRVRATDGLAGRLDDRPRVAYVKGKRAQTTEDDESWRADEVTPTLNAFDVGDTRATTLLSGGEQSYHQRDRIHSDIAPALDARAHSPSDPPMVAGNLGVGPDDPLLPLGLDSHRYRTIGNGVVAPVAEWIGRRLADYLRGEL